MEEKIKKTELHSESSKAKGKFQIYSSLAFMIVVVVIGVPMWWKTTEVYRSVLPDVDIKNLDADNIKISLSIFIYTSDIQRSTNLIKGIETNFVYDDIFALNFVQLKLETNNIKTPAGLENLVKKDANIKTGDFVFIEWKSLKEDILITSERSAFISKTVSAEKLQKVLLINILKVENILKIINEDKSDRLHGIPVLNQHNVIISILNPDPDIMDVKWNIRTAAQLYLEPFLNYVNPISNYTLKTQFKYQVPFEFPLKQIRDDSKIGRHYGLSEEELPHIITLIEKNLGSITSDNPIINLVVYVPPCEISPLYIYGQNEKPNPNVRNISIESFSSPKWGGVVIHNPPIELCEKYQEKPQKVSFSVKSKEVMQSLLYQLQKFYEINTYVEMDNIKIVEIESLYPREWQFDAYIRRTTVSHILTTIRTLQSLIQLLDNISYIVINDDVGQSINSAYENVLKAKKYLADGDLMEAMIYAREGYLSSERAFFDASLLAQLYFPDEQKYAIYIPLFLPIMVPVVTSLVMILKWYFKPRTMEKIKTN